MLPVLHLPPHGRVHLHGLQRPLHVPESRAADHPEWTGKDSGGQGTSPRGDVHPDGTDPNVPGDTPPCVRAAVRGQFVLPESQGGDAMSDNEDRISLVEKRGPCWGISGVCVQMTESAGFPGHQRVGLWPSWLEMLPCLGHDPGAGPGLGSPDPLDPLGVVCSVVQPGLGHRKKRTRGKAGGGGGDRAGVRRGDGRPHRCLAWVRNVSPGSTSLFLSPAS